MTKEMTWKEFIDIFNKKHNPEYYYGKEKKKNRKMAGKTRRGGVLELAQKKRREENTSGDSLFKRSRRVLVSVPGDPLSLEIKFMASPSRTVPSPEHGT